MGWDMVGIELLKKFASGEAIIVVVQACLGKEYILKVRADTGKLDIGLFVDLAEFP